jgi:hypothetical protein
MSKSAPVFRAISAPLDVDDSEIDRVADHLAMPKMVRPSVAPLSVQQPYQPLPQPAPPQSASIETVPSVTVERTVPNSTKSPEERITCDLPTYLCDALRLEGAKRRASIRHLIMLGLQATGFEIKPEDLIQDGRRTHNRRR